MKLLTTELPFNLTTTDIIALLAAIIGVLGAYISSIYLENRKQKELINRFHSILLFEILRQHISLTNYLDYSLPVWLVRDEDESDFYFTSLKRTPPTLDESFYNSFLDKLSHSPKFVSLAFYYEGIKRCNELAKEWKDNPDKNIKRSYIRDNIAMLQASSSAIIDLLATKNIEKNFTPVLKNYVEEFHNQDKSNKVRIAIS